jgi:4-amino-4-deoxy-L-arabinose transferase-like glycosyltransferase
MARKILFVSIIFLALLLRIFQFGINPPSLSWDEASLGYNAYSILTSGKDEHGEFLPLARFIAFGDYKPPGYIYADIPFIGVIGVNEQAVRTPSLLAGLVMVITAYFLALEIFQNYRIALFSSFLVAISPWSIHFSRAAFEAHLAAVFNILAVYIFLVSSGKAGYSQLLPYFLLFLFIRLTPTELFPRFFFWH